MAGIKKEDLLHLSNTEIKEFYTVEHYSKLPECKAKMYISASKEKYELSSRINRVKRLLNNIVVDRFINGKIK